jgi:hypothetical protein
MVSIIKYNCGDDVDLSWEIVNDEIDYGKNMFDEMNADLDYVWVNENENENEKENEIDEETEYLYRIIDSQKLILTGKYCNEPIYDKNSLINLKNHLEFIIKENEKLILEVQEEKYKNMYESE